MTLSLRAVRAGPLELRTWGAEAPDPEAWRALDADVQGCVDPSSTTLRWDDRHPALGLAPLVLFDQTTYLVVVGRGHRLVPSLEAPRIAVDAEGRTLHALTFRGHAGRVHVTAGEVTLDAELCLRREGAAEEWRAMLDELCAADLALAARVDARSEASLGRALDTRRRSPVEVLWALHQLMRSGVLQEALAAIARAPVTAVATRVNVVPLARVTRLHPDELAARGACADAVAREQGPALTRDTPENRFVVGCLVGFCALARTLASEASPLHDRVLRRLAGELATFFDALREEALRGPLAGVREASGERRVPLALCRRRGYRELFVAWERLQTAPRPCALVGEETLGLADAPRLYERWCALELARAVGLDADAAVAFAAGGGIVRVPTTEGDVTLASQVSGGSYGLAFRPDFVLRSGGRVLVFDAKYQVDEPEGRVPRDAVVKMHAYRDGIAGVEAAWALFPGTRSERWDAPDGGGVGALALRPGGNGRDGLRALVEAFVLAGHGVGCGRTPSR